MASGLWIGHLQADTAGSCPLEAGGCALPRPVFAADPAGKARTVDQTEQKGIVHLAVVRLTAVRGSGNLVVASDGGERFDGRRHVALRDLAVVEVELQAQIRLAYLGD